MQIDNLELPGNLHWPDEHEFKPGVQSTGRTLTGALLVQYAPLSYGQKIQLTGAWITAADLVAVLALESEPMTKRVLTLNGGATHSVIFDLESGGVQAVPVAPETTPTDETLYDITINLLTVEPDA